MGTLVAHQLGGALVEQDELVLRTVAKVGAFGGREANEERIPIGEIEQILILDGKHPDFVFRVGEQLMGIHVSYQKMQGIDGVEYSPARRLAEEITVVNPRSHGFRSRPV